MPTPALTIQGEKSVYIYLGACANEKFEKYTVIVQHNN